ncbi:uncharacterized protein LOC143446690 [Clavelina lepadiformis]|uniref:uncharacterized protein LOC143446690 n=1 Tax=Clavelina lepadiformis TaxID=159417 RepID=UPI0040416E78
MADQVDSSSTSSNDTTSATERVTPNSEKNIGTINRTFRIPSHGESVLQALNKQRSGGEFCDVTVLVEHKRFSAHKCVLSANSEYFRSLLCTDNDGVFLRHVTASSFQAILDFMYTSRLQLEPNSVQNILTTAKFLQVKGVISICCRYLESQIRSLAKDLDGRKKKLKNPAVISVDAEVFKEKELPMLSTLQQQPQINYNSVTGTFGPAAPTAQNLIRGPHPQLFPFQKPPINSQSNGLNGPAYQRTTLPLVVHGQTSEMVHHDQRHHMLPWKNVHDPQQTQNPYGNNIHTNPTSYQIPFSIAHNQARQAPMMYSHGKYNPNHPLYTAQSTGGKGRRQHPQNRRKPNYGAGSTGYLPTRYRHR